MNRHLVAIKVGVVTGAHQGVQADGVAFNQHRFESLDTHAVQGRSTVQQHGMLVNDFFKDVPNLRIPAFQHALGALDCVGETAFLQFSDDERLVKLEGNLLGKTALPKLQIRTHHDDRTSGVVHPLAEQVLTEAPLLALDHVRDGLEGPVRRAQDRTTASTIVEQRVNGLLQHALFVADNDLRGVQVHQLLETVVPVDDPAIQIVEVAGGEVARVQKDEWPQVRRNDGNNVKHHPGRIIVGILQLLDQLQPLGDVLDPLLRTGGFQLFTQVDRDLMKIQSINELSNGLSAHHGGESLTTVLLNLDAVVVFGKDLHELEFGRPGLDHNIVLEVDNLLDVRGLHRQQRAKTRWQRFEVPNVNARRCQIDVAHPLAANPRVGDFHTTAVTNDAFELGAAVLAARAFVVLFRTENAFAEQAVFFGTVGAVVDGLRFLDFTKGPRTDVVGGSKIDLDASEVVDAVVDGFGHCGALNKGTKREERGTGAKMSVLVTRPAVALPRPSEFGCSCRDP